MNDISQVITHIFNNAALPLVITAMAALILAYVNRNQLRLAWLNFKTDYCLSRLGLEQLTGIQCPDGLGDHFTLDRVLLRHDGITLLISKQYPGRIFCSEHIEYWTQMLGQKSYRFKNPLFELEHQLRALSDCIPSVDIDGYLFFDGLSEFPKGHPRRIIYPGNIPEAIRKNNRHQVKMQVMQAWKALKAMATD